MYTLGETQSLILFFIFILAMTAGAYLLNPSGRWPFRYGVLLLAVGVSLRICTMAATRHAWNEPGGWLLLDIPLILAGVALLLGGWLHRRRHCSEHDEPTPPEDTINPLAG